MLFLFSIHHQYLFFLIEYFIPTLKSTAINSWEQLHFHVYSYLLLHFPLQLVATADAADSGAPNVSQLDAQVPTDSVPKSNIGVRKIQPKRAGICVRKGGGLGATQSKVNFADLEHRANMADQVKSEAPPAPEKSAAEQADTIASVRLAYQDLSLQKTKEEERMKNIDPTKAKQMERLGMGFNKRGAGISHSVDMQTIKQESAPQQSTSTTSKSKVSSIFADDEPEESDFYGMASRMDRPAPSSMSGAWMQFEDAELMGFDTLEPIDQQHSKVQTMFAQSSTGRKASDGSGNSSSNSRTTAGGTKYKVCDNDAAQKKFANAKAISSDQYFGGRESTTDKSNTLNRFQDSESISSDQYFNKDTSSSYSRGKQIRSVSREFTDHH